MKLTLLPIALFAIGCADDAEPIARKGAGTHKGTCYAADDTATATPALVKVDLAAETLTPIEAPFEFTQPFFSSLAFVDGKLLACDHGPIHVFDLDTQQYSTIERDCHGIASDGKSIWTTSLLTRELVEYASYADLEDDDRTSTLAAPYASRLGVSPNGLLAAWHSAAEVIAVDPKTGAETPIALPDYDGWIFGLYEDKDTRYVVGGFAPEDRGVRTYDAKTGAAKGTLFADKFIRGLACAD